MAWILNSPFYFLWSAGVLSFSLFVPQIFTLNLRARVLIFLPMLLLCAKNLTEALQALNEDLTNVLHGESIVIIKGSFRQICMLIPFILMPTISLLAEVSSPVALVFQPFMKPIKGIKSHWLGSLLSMLLLFLPAFMSLLGLLNLNWTTQTIFRNVNSYSISASASAFLSIIPIVIFFFWMSLSPTQSATHRPVFSGLLLFLYPILHWVTSLIAYPRGNSGNFLITLIHLAVNALVYASLVVDPRSCFGRAYRPFVAVDDDIEEEVTV